MIYFSLLRLAAIGIVYGALVVIYRRNRKRFSERPFIRISLILIALMFAPVLLASASHFFADIQTQRAISLCERALYSPRIHDVAGVAELEADSAHTLDEIRNRAVSARPTIDAYDVDPAMYFISVVFDDARYELVVAHREHSNLLIQLYGPYIYLAGVHQH